jgi:predicted AAA+ superfamily ATPase
MVAGIEAALGKRAAFLHLLVGPRQVGKTTAAHQVERSWPGPTRYAAADQYLPAGPEWVRTHWDLARADGRRDRRAPLLILDEVQKVRDWSEVVKAEWDADRAAKVPVRVMLLGSSALLLARGASESLAGRFLLHRFGHWSYPECKAAFGWTLDDWLWRGGYPGGAEFGDDDERRAWVRDSLVEAALARDVLATERVAKPALLRQLFALVCHYPAQPLSYTKMLGQLQDAGNTTTLAHYLQLLHRAFLAGGLEPYAAGAVPRRGGSPKLLAFNNGLVTAFESRSRGEIRADGARWGRLVENAVGAHLVNGLQGRGVELSWWRDGDFEVDFVVGGRTAIEVKTGRSRPGGGLEVLTKKHPHLRPMVVGHGGVALEEFFGTEATEWVGERP